MKIDIIILLIIFVLGLIIYQVHSNIAADNYINELFNDQCKEPFIVADAQDINNYQTLKNQTLAESDTFDKPKNVYINATDFGTDAPYPAVGCANSSIESRYKMGPNQILPSMISCQYPNKLTAENYYKTHFNGQSIPLDTGKIMRGYNYLDYNNTVSPTGINFKILSPNAKGLPYYTSIDKQIPIASNYVFTLIE